MLHKWPKRELGATVLHSSRQPQGDTSGGHTPPKATTAVEAQGGSAPAIGASLDTRIHQLSHWTCADAR